MILDGAFHAEVDLYSSADVQGVVFEATGLAAARRDLSRRDLTSGINLFRSVRVGDDGSLTLLPPTDEASHVELRAELDVVVLVAVNPHPLDDRPEPSAGLVRFTGWEAPPTPHDDPFRATTPERERAFQNTEQFVGAIR